MASNHHAANVDYSLDGPARTWFRTYEAEVTSWDICKERLRKLFGNPAGHQLAAKNALATRAQTSTESYVAYIQDVLSLCKKADAQMSESDKVGHVLKGIADDAFHLLICKDCATVEAIIIECRRFEQVKSRRITSQFTRLPNTAATSSCEDIPPQTQTRSPPISYGVTTATAPPDGLTRIVRREPEAMAPAALPQYVAEYSSPPVPLIQAVVREELAKLGVQSVCAITRANFPSGPFPPTSDGRAPYTRTLNYPIRNPAYWRTPDDRPICFHCHRVGHVARYCQSRRFMPPRPRFPAYNNPEEGPARFSPRPQTPSRDDDARPRRNNRSPSPHRRQSRSPQPRRFLSPTPYDRSSPEN